NHILSVRTFIITEVILIGIFYFENLKNNNVKKVLKLFIGLFVIYSFYDYFSSDKMKFNFLPLVIECIFFLTVIIYYFFELMQYSIANPIYTLASFWISVAFLIYFSGNFFLFLFQKTMSADPGFVVQSAIIYSTVTIL